jgi:hypothetical protein
MGMPQTPKPFADPTFQPGTGRVSRAATQRALKTCPLCNSRVREDRLQKHMSKRCASRPNKHAARPKQLPASVAPESMRYKGAVEAERPAWWNNLDATKNYGFPVREAGRYGSHPSHDAFDDESGPG